MYKYYINPFINLFKFRGRSSLKEFWYFYLINFIISILLIFTKNIHGIYKLEMYYLYVSTIPFISLGFRRIQDTGKTGFLFLIPFVNLILCALNGDDQENKFGMPPAQ